MGKPDEPYYVIAEGDEEKLSSWYTFSNLCKADRPGGRKSLSPHTPQLGLRGSRPILSVLPLWSWLDWFGVSYEQFDFLLNDPLANPQKSPQQLPLARC